jgi:hypothetical protein
MLSSPKGIAPHHSSTFLGSATHRPRASKMQRRFILGATAAFSAAAVGARGHATAEGSQAPASQQSLGDPIKLDRRNAQLRLVQVVFRYADIRSRQLCCCDRHQPPSTCQNSVLLLQCTKTLCAICVFVRRHGARTPLTDASYLWEGQEWNVGGAAYKASKAAACTLLVLHACMRAQQRAMENCDTCIYVPS